MTLPGTGISNQLTGLAELAKNEKVIEAAEKRAKAGRIGTHEGKRKPKKEAVVR